ncbi:MAG: hypothetical protein ACKVT2_03530 [Saprospiraceae bacterium]
MAKNSIFLLLICTLISGIAGLSSATERTFLEDTSATVESCDAPAPDSFHVTNAGTNFVNLIWQPAWPSATQTLVILKNDTYTNAWVSVDTIYNLSGSSYTFSNAQYGSTYRFVIATNCSNGEVSERTATIDHIELILDLTIAGLTPINPVTVPGVCPEIDYPAYNWVGFKIQNFNEFASASTLYEFKTNTENGNLYPVIKRVNYDGPMMAVAKSFLGTELKYPTWAIPIIRVFGSYSFVVRQYKDEINYITVGKVEVTLQQNPDKVKICIDSSEPWNPSYIITPLIAEMANGFTPSGNESQTCINCGLNEVIKAQSPFKDILNVFLPPSFVKRLPIKFQMLSLNGEVVIEHQFEAVSDPISISTEMLPRGFYMLRIEANGETQILKTIKAD